MATTRLLDSLLAHANPIKNPRTNASCPPKLDRATLAIAE
jgi:hypothetical protein